MKLSKFNVWHRERERLLIFNSFTIALAEFDGFSATCMTKALTANDLSMIPPEFVEALREDGFIVDSGKNELALLSEIVDERVHTTDTLNLSVMLSLRCNFGCVYCYEGLNLRNGGNAVKPALILDLFNNLPSHLKRVEMDWFGGEPLVTFGLMRELNDQLQLECARRRLEYTASLTTNGYLLEGDVLQYICESRFSHAVVTLDGPPDQHDKLRPLRNGGGTFRKILRNVQTAVEAGLHVILRINLTSANVDRVIEAYDVLDDAGLKNQVEVSLQQVVSSDVNPCDDLCLSTEDFARVAMETYKRAAEKGWIVFPHIDSIRSLGYCIADYPGRLIIGMDGRLYKCGELSMTGEYIGRLDAGILKIDDKKHSRWVGKSPLGYKECRECQIAPICMGGCNLKRFHKQGSCCVDLKYVLPEFLEVLVINQSNLESFSC